MGKVLKFILKVISEKQATQVKLYDAQVPLLVKLFKTMLDPTFPLIPELPSIALYIFLLFPASHSPLLTHLAQSLYPLKLKSAFDTLICLLTDLQSSQST